MPVEVVTLGCRLNTFESEGMRKAAREAGHEDLVIVNTCAVTAEAVRQARQTIRRLHREKPGARIDWRQTPHQSIDPAEIDSAVKFNFKHSLESGEECQLSISFDFS